RHQLHAAIGGGEVIDEHRRLARVIGAEAGIGHAGLIGHTLPADAADGLVHRLAHLLVHRCHAAFFALVIPGEAHAVGDLLDDPQVLARIAGHVERAATH